MLVEVCKNPDIVYFWISQEEHENTITNLSEQRNEWIKKGFKVCTFISGRENLVGLTKDLLLHNKEVISKSD